MQNIAEDLTPLARDIDELHLDPANLRLHNERSIESVAASLREFGQRKPIVVRKEDKIVIAGNGTLQAAKSLGWKQIAAVFMDDDAITATRYAIADNRTAELSDWDEESLVNMLKALEDDDWAVPGFDGEDLEKLFEQIAEHESTNDKTEYSSKVKIPLYEPKRDKPGVDVLMEKTKTMQILDDIEEAVEQSEISKEEAHFLRHAAQRHTVFNFSKIADFYAHSGDKMKDLMERSALVIIDYDKALENGFVAMTEAIRQAYEDDHGGE